MKVRPGSSFVTPFGEVASDFGLKGCAGVVVAFNTENEARCFDPEATVIPVSVPPVVKSMESARVRARKGRA